MNLEKEKWKEVMELLSIEPVTLSPKISSAVRTSMTGLLHILARYKFAMKMMQNRDGIRIIDFGCNDGFGGLM